MAKSGCTCQRCGQKYKVDFLVPDKMWEWIKPRAAAEGGGLLCGPCIAEKIERMNGFGTYRLEVDNG